MWQEILIIIIGLFVLGYIVWKVIRFFTRKDVSPCTGCHVGCQLKGTKDALIENCKKISKK